MHDPTGLISHRHLATVMLLSLFVHVAFAFMLFWQKPSSGSPRYGVGGIQIDLGVAGGAPGSVEETSAPVQDSELLEEAQEVTEISEALPETIEEEELSSDIVAEMVEAVEIETTRDLEADKPIEDVTEEVEAVDVEAAEATVETIAQDVVARKPPPPPPAKPTRPRKQKPAVKQVVEAKQSEVPKPSTPDKTRTTAEKPRAKPAEVETTAGSAGRSGTKQKPGAGSGVANAGGSPPGASADFRALIQAFLEKHKKYPRRARSRRQQGTAVLRFVMDRDGRVLSHSITQSSGYKLLDAEVTAMLERAEPLPKAPADVTAERFTFAVPIAFYLR